MFTYPLQMDLFKIFLIIIRLLPTWILFRPEISISTDLIFLMLKKTFMSFSDSLNFSNILSFNIDLHRYFVKYSVMFVVKLLEDCKKYFIWSTIRMKKWVTLLTNQRTLFENQMFRRRRFAEIINF